MAYYYREIVDEKYQVRRIQENAQRYKSFQEELKRDKETKK